jgi:hypothetical protein
MKATRLTPLKSIRQHCLECVGNWYQVKYCEQKICVFYAYRAGKNPFRKGIGNPKAFLNLHG